MESMLQFSDLNFKAIFQTKNSWIQGFLVWFWAFKIQISELAGFLRKSKFATKLGLLSLALCTIFRNKEYSISSKKLLEF